MPIGPYFTYKLTLLSDVNNVNSRIRKGIIFTL